MLVVLWQIMCYWWLFVHVFALFLYILLLTPLCQCSVRVWL